MNKQYVDNKYNIFVAIEHHKKENTFFAGFIQVKKDLKDNKIYGLTLGKSCRDNFTLDELNKFIRENVNFQVYSNRLDMIIASTPNFSFDNVEIIERHPYRIDNEDKLIDLYKIYQNKFNSGKSGIQIQQLGIGKGLYLDDVSKPVRLRIDYAEIKIQTFAIMFVIDEVLKNKARNLVRSVLLLNEDN